MNCPYCNQLCDCLNDLDWSCKKCVGTPIFSDWNKDCNFSSLHVAVTFVINNYVDYLDFYPNTQEIIIDSLNRRFKVNFVVTPDNVNETYNRFSKMKVFL